MWTKTNADDPDGSMDENGPVYSAIYLDICNSEGTYCCSTNDLDNQDKDDFQLGGLDLFKGSLLGSCKNYIVTENAVYKVRWML